MNKLLIETAGFVAGLFGGYVLIVVSAAVLARFPGMTEAHAASMTDLGVLIAPFGAVVSGLMCSIGTLRVMRGPRWPEVAPAAVLRVREANSRGR